MRSTFSPYPTCRFLWSLSFSVENSRALGESEMPRSQGRSRRSCVQRWQHCRRTAVAQEGLRSTGLRATLPSSRAYPQHHAPTVAPLRPRPAPRRSAARRACQCPRASARRRRAIVDRHRAGCRAHRRRAGEARPRRRPRRTRAPQGRRRDPRRRRHAGHRARPGHPRGPLAPRRLHCPPPPGRSAAPRRGGQAGAPAPIPQTISVVRSSAALPPTSAPRSSPALAWANCRR